MSIRLNVIYSSPIGTNHAHQAREEKLVTELISQPGLDLNLIGPLEHLGHSPTDRLLLDGIESDLAIASWNSPEQVVQWLQEVGLTGYRTPHRLDPNAPPATNQAGKHRKWYLIDLRNLDPLDVMEGLRGVLQARRTPTVNLMLGAPQVKDAERSKAPLNAQRPAEGLHENTSGPSATPNVKQIDSLPQLAPLSTTNPIAEPIETEAAKYERLDAPNQRISKNLDKPKDDLDHLMDDLDAWDIG